MKYKFILVNILLLILLTGCNKVTKTLISPEKLKEDIYPQIVSSTKYNLTKNQHENIKSISSPEILEIREYNGRYFVLYTYGYTSTNKDGRGFNDRKVIRFQEIQKNEGAYRLSGNWSESRTLELKEGILAVSYKETWQYGLIFDPRIEKVAVVYSDGITISQQVNGKKYYLMLRADTKGVKVKRIEAIDSSGKVLFKRLEIPK